MQDPIASLPQDLKSQLNAELAEVDTHYKEWVDHPFTRTLIEGADVWTRQHETLLIENPDNQQYRLAIALGKAIRDGWFARTAYNAARSGAKSKYRAVAKQAQLKADPDAGEGARDVPSFYASLSPSPQRNHHARDNGQ